MKAIIKSAAVILSGVMVVSLSGCTYGLTAKQSSTIEEEETSSVSSAALVDFNTESSEASSEVSSAEAGLSEEASSEVSSKEASSSKATSSKAASSKAASKAVSSKAAASKAASKETVASSSAASSDTTPYLFITYKTNSSGVCKITLKNAGKYQITSATILETTDTIKEGVTLDFSIDKTVLTATATGAGVFKIEITAENSTDGTQIVLETTVKAYQD